MTYKETKRTTKLVIKIILLFLILESGVLMYFKQTGGMIITGVLFVLIGVFKDEIADVIIQIVDLFILLPIFEILAIGLSFCWALMVLCYILFKSLNYGIGGSWIIHFIGIIAIILFAIGQKIRRGCQKEK